MIKILAVFSNALTAALSMVAAFAVIVAVADVFGWRFQTAIESATIQSSASIAEVNVVPGNRS